MRAFATTYKSSRSGRKFGFEPGQMPIEFGLVVDIGFAAQNDAPRGLEMLFRVVIPNVSVCHGFTFLPRSMASRCSDSARSRRSAC